MGITSRSLRCTLPLREFGEEAEEKEEEEGLFKADAVNEEDPERDQEEVTEERAGRRKRISSP